MIWLEGLFTKLEFILEKNVLHCGSSIDLAKTRMFNIVIVRVLHSVPPGNWTIESGFWWWKMGNLQSIYFPFSCNCIWTWVFMFKFVCMYNSASMLNVRSVVCLLIYIIYVLLYVRPCLCCILHHAFWTTYVIVIRTLAQTSSFPTHAHIPRCHSCTLDVSHFVLSHTFSSCSIHWHLPNIVNVICTFLSFFAHLQRRFIVVVAKIVLYGFRVRVDDKWCWWRW